MVDRNEGGGGGGGGGGLGRVVLLVHKFLRCKIDHVDHMGLAVVSLKLYIDNKLD